MLSTDFTGALITQDRLGVFIYLLFNCGKLETHGDLEATSFDSAKKEMRKLLRLDGIEVRKVEYDSDGVYTPWIEPMKNEGCIFNGDYEFGSFNFGQHMDDDDYDGSIPSYEEFMTIYGKDPFV